MSGTRWRAALVGAGALATVAVAGPASAEAFSAWEPAIAISELSGSHADVNTEHLDGCPILSPDGHSLYIASNRPTGSVGALDIWVAHRDDTDEGFGAPVNLGAPVNSTANDFCPTPLRGNRLLFVSDRTGGCGAADMYLTRWTRATGWSAPQNLGCAPAGPNTSAAEAGPSYVARGSGSLFFSSTVTGNSDLYVSTGKVRKGFGAAVAVAGLNTAAEDARPNVRHDGLEIVFDSNRPGSRGFDVWTATRTSLSSAWSAPVNVAVVNTAANETRPSLSWDAETMLFGRAPGPEGSTDIYLTTRDEHDEDDEDDDADDADDSDDSDDSDDDD